MENKFQLYTINAGHEQSLRKNSQGKKISLKNLRDRYNNAINKGNSNMKSIKPLEELRDNFNLGSKNSNLNRLNQNLLIQQNDAY